MNWSKLKRLKRQLEKYRGGIHNVRASQLVSLALQLGRRPSSRGKEPTYVSDLLPMSRPISIPGHPGTLATGTVRNILDRLEQDIFEFEEELTRTGGNHGDHDD